MIRFDGMDFQEFGNVEGLTDKPIKAIKETKRGEVYVLGKRKLFRKERNGWKSFPDMGKSQGRRIVEGGSGRVWFAAEGRLISVLGENMEKSKRLTNRIVDIEWDRSGWMWALDSNGTLFRCSTQEGLAIVEQKWEGPGPARKSRYKSFGMVEQTSDGRIWVVDSNPNTPPRYLNVTDDKWIETDLLGSGGTHRNYAIIEPEEGRLLISGDESISYMSGRNWRSIDNALLNLTDRESFMAMGKDGYLWVLQTDNRFARIDYQANRWKSFPKLNFQSDWGGNKACFLSEAGELVIRNTHRDEWLNYGLQDGLIDNALVVIPSSRGDLWIAGSHENQAAVSQFDGKKFVLHQLPELGAIISRFSARSLSDGSLVFGSGQEEGLRNGIGGIVRFRYLNGRYVKERLRNSHPRVISIKEDPYGDLLYSKDQIYRFADNQFSPLDVPLEFRVRWIDDFHIQENGNLWFCNWGEGIRFFDGNNWHSFSENEGLSSNYVSNLLVLGLGDVFALTAKGLDRFHDGRWQKVNGPEFNGIREGSTLKLSSDGFVWVSLANRAWYFRQESRLSPTKQFRCWRFKADDLAPKTFVAFEPPGSKYSNSVYMTWSGRDPWAETPAKDLEFSYQIDQEEWSAFSLEKSMYISKLEPGNHTFKVKARDQDGNIDPNPAVLSLSIYAPFWQSTWFIALIIVIPIAVIGLIFLLLMQRLRHMAELDKVRTRFITNVSHELRSPLALIMMPLEKFLNENNTNEYSKGLGTALRNAKRLSLLVEQLLELRKAKAGSLKIHPKCGDMIRFTKAVLADLNNIASSRKQQLHVSFNADVYNTYFDQDVYHKILDNLVLNAIKHSPSLSNISVTLSFGAIGGFGEDKIRLIVEDHGYGIEPDILKRIFEPFYHYQRKNCVKQNQRSFGIGLALVKELVDLCGATIAVESPTQYDNGRKYGSRFIVEFQEMPAIEEILIPSDFNEGPVDETENSTIPFPDVLSKKQNEKALILLVEDHIELREYIAEELAPEFTVIQAANGREGVDVAMERMPDLIVADVVMPEMDGIAFCHAIKENLSTSHIPIILQTSLASEEKETRGLGAGAIDYITRPISMTLLAGRIRNQLKIQKQYAIHLRSQLLAPTDEDTSSAKNDAELEFVNEIRSILQKNWINADFKTETLARYLGMSRSSFYQKFKAIIHLSPATVIKNYRLDKAADLLRQGKPVCEVASLVGYSETSPFYRAFKKRFHCGPSEFQKKDKGA